MEKTMLSSSEMMEKAGLNWKVLQAPVLFEGNGLTSYNSRKVNFRSDTGAALGIVSDTYKVVQNSTAFAFLDSFLGDEIESYVKAGNYKGGSQVYLRAKLPGSLTFAKNSDDKGEKFVDFFTSHDGSIALEVSIMAFRLVCSNGLKMLKSISAVRKKHTINMSLSNIKSELGMIQDQFSIMEKLSEKMAEQPVSQGKLVSILETVGVVPKEDKRSTRALNIIDEVSRLFDRGAGTNLRNVRGTAWGAYNAITEYVDHYRGSDTLKRQESSAVGSGARLKERALEVLSI